jgi:hypothetical protein
MSTIQHGIALILLLFVFTVFVAVYVLPAIVASKRRHISVVNVHRMVPTHRCGLDLLI